MFSKAVKSLSAVALAVVVVAGGSPAFAASGGVTEKPKGGSLTGGSLTGGSLTGGSLT